MDCMNAANQGKRAALLLLALAILAGTEGCTRRFYRQRADREVDAILREKEQCLAIPLENYEVYPDPRARFGDPTNPDRPPMPPDDPGAHDCALNPQRPGKAGIAWIEGKGYLDLLRLWDAQNRGIGLTPAVEETDPAFCHGILGLPLAEPPVHAGTPEHPFKIKLEQAAELGVVNSRDFQDRREDLYLRALPVTQERFSFAYQFFATTEAIRERTGSQTPEGPGQRWRLNSSTGFRKLFSTGALLLFSWANRTVIELTGAGPHTISVSTLNLDLVQPLLQGAGKAVTLEPLTLAERNLLYEIRDYARFRKEFFVNIAAGGNITGGAGAPSEGYLSTLLKAAFVETERKNLANLERFLKQFEAMEEGGVISSLQVNQVRQDLLRSRSSVLGLEQSARLALDNLKLQLGLPVPLPLELDNEILRPVAEQMSRYENLNVLYFDTVKRLNILDTIEDAKKARAVVREVLTTSELVKGTKSFRVDFPKRWAVWEGLNKKEIEDRRDKLKIELNKLLDQKAQAEIGKGIWTRELQARLFEVRADLRAGDLETSLRKLAEPIKKAVDPKVQGVAELRLDVKDMASLILFEAVNEQLVLLRDTWPTLPPVAVAGVDVLTAELETAQEIVAQTALANRLDLMNARAQAHDAWRQILIFSNSLLGVFNVGYHLDSSTPAGEAKPLAFHPSRTRHQLILDAELPLVRLAERNAYRASLIAYQRQRRTLMEAEDNVVAQVRNDVRLVRRAAEIYKIQLSAVELAYSQVENSLQTFVAPPDPTRIGRTDAGTEAALTTQLLQAQGRLLGAQNQLYSTWIDYISARLQLYLDLELLPLDSRGVWIDELASSEPRGPSDAGDAGSPRAGPLPGSERGEQLPSVRLLPPAQAPGLEPAR
jgi:outer membrane protein TolC